MPTARTLSDLSEGDCRFPVGAATGRAQLFCGQPAGDGSYCPACAALTRVKGSAMSSAETSYWLAFAERDTTRRRAA